MPESKRYYHLQVRFTQVERRKLEAKARRVNMSLSAYSRAALNAAMLGLVDRVREFAEAQDKQTHMLEEILSRLSIKEES